MDRERENYLRPNRNGVTTGFPIQKFANQHNPSAADTPVLAEVLCESTG